MEQSRSVGQACIAFGPGGGMVGPNINTASSNGPYATDHVAKRPLILTACSLTIHPSEISDAQESECQARENRHVA
jgi:hypothetical protein